MNAYLLLANGMVFAGQSVGAEGVTVGEVVFATGMVGFEETLTDPSYYGQIITQTYPLIGNYGMNKDDMESDRIWAKGYIVREACTTPSNWRCEETLDSFLKKNNTIGIEGIDTRHLTRIIRESGVMNGAILTTFDPADPANKAETEKLLETIRAYAVTDAVKSVTCEKPEVFHEKGETHMSIGFSVYGLEKTLGNVLREASNSVLYYGRIVFTSLIDLLRGRESINNLSGPVGIVSAIGQAASYGWQDLLELLALITVNVGIFNLLPFPALDGGKVVFLLIEGVTGHAVPEKIQSGLIVAAFALLFGLMIFATYNDILRLITGAM